MPQHKRWVWRSPQASSMLGFNQPSQASQPIGVCSSLAVKSEILPIVCHLISPRELVKLHYSVSKLFQSKAFKNTCFPFTSIVVRDNAALISIQLILFRNSTHIHSNMFLIMKEVLIKLRVQY